MITTGQATITTTRQILDGTATNPYRLVIHNSGTNSVYLGNQDVTRDNGLNLHTSSTLILELPPLTTIYAIAASGSHEVSWMRID